MDIEQKKKEVESLIDLVGVVNSMIERMNQEIAEEECPLKVGDKFDFRNKTLSGLNPEYYEFLGVCEYINGWVGRYQYHDPVTDGIKRGKMDIPSADEIIILPNDANATSSPDPS